MNVVRAVRSPTGGGSQSQLHRAEEARPKGAGQSLWVGPLGGGTGRRDGSAFSGFQPFSTTLSAITR